MSCTSSYFKPLSVTKLNCHTEVMKNKNHAPRRTVYKLVKSKYGKNTWYKKKEEKWKGKEIMLWLCKRSLGKVKKSFYGEFVQTMVKLVIAARVMIGQKPWVHGDASLVDSLWSWILDGFFFIFTTFCICVFLIFCRGY